MIVKEKLSQFLIEKISDSSKKIRSIEDECSKFSVAPESNGVYIAVVAYRKAMQEVLENIRSINDTEPI